MKKKAYVLLVAGLLTLSLAAGCGQKAADNANAGQSNVQSEAQQSDASAEEKQSETVTESTEQETSVTEAGEEQNGGAASTEEKTLTGTIEEIKDFMFIVVDESGAEYEFSFDEKPQGLENVAVGDNVLVTYTGEVSEVDAFNGTVLSVEKQQEKESK